MPFEPFTDRELRRALGALEAPAAAGPQATSCSSRGRALSSRRNPRGKMGRSWKARPLASKWINRKPAVDPYATKWDSNKSSVEGV